MRGTDVELGGLGAGMVGAGGEAGEEYSTSSGWRPKRLDASRFRALEARHRRQHRRMIKRHGVHARAATADVLGICLPHSCGTAIKLLAFPIALGAFAGCVLYLGDSDANKHLGSSVGAVVMSTILWTLQPVPPFLTALLFLMTLRISGALTFEQAFAGAASESNWLVWAGVVVGAALKESKIDRWVAHKFTAHLTSFRGLLLAVHCLGLTLVLGVPSGTARVALLLPIVHAAAEGFHASKPQKECLLIGAILSTVLTGSGIMTGLVGNLVAQALAVDLFGVNFSWPAWAVRMFPVFGLGQMLVLYGVLSVRYRHHMGNTAPELAAAAMDDGDGSDGSDGDGSGDDARGDRDGPQTAPVGRGGLRASLLGGTVDDHDVNSRGGGMGLGSGGVGGGGGGGGAGDDGRRLKQQRSTLRGELNSSAQDVAAAAPPDLAAYFKEEPGQASDPVESGQKMSLTARKLVGFVLVALACWVLDTTLGVSPATIGIVLALVTYWPIIGAMDSKKLRPATNFTVFIFFTSVFAVSKALEVSGALATVSKFIQTEIDLSGLPLLLRVSAVSALAVPLTFMTKCIISAGLLVPAIGQLAPQLGLSYDMVVCAVVQGANLTWVPYQSAPVLVATTLVSGDEMRGGELVKTCVWVSAIGLVVMVPLNVLYWAAVGWI